MDYLIECRCGHDLTRHGETGCRGNRAACSCTRTRLEALDGAIEQARISPWAEYLRHVPVDDSDEAAATA